MMKVPGLPFGRTLMRNRQGKEESASLVQLQFDPNFAAMGFDESTTDHQT